MALIKTAAAPTETVKSLEEFVRVSRGWHQRYRSQDQGMLSDLWYRGVNRHFDAQCPGIYRDSVTDRAKKLNVKGNVEDKRLYLERCMISQFRTAGAQFLERYDILQIYLIAQHHGMPTRLLDWSTNPLAALFFACSGEPGEDGFVYAMDAAKIIPPDARRSPDKALLQSVMTIRHPHFEYAVKVSLWEELNGDKFPFILPVRPDHLPGRIGQQSSCFTMHMHNAPDADNPTMIIIRIDKEKKTTLLEELHTVNINQFTAFYDLDHLSKEIKGGWGCK